MLLTQKTSNNLLIILNHSVNIFKNPTKPRFAYSQAGFVLLFFGGPDADRTRDFLNAIQATSPDFTGLRRGFVAYLLLVFSFPNLSNPRAKQRSLVISLSLSRLIISCNSSIGWLAPGFICCTSVTILVLNPSTKNKMIRTSDFCCNLLKFLCQ